MPEEKPEEPDEEARQRVRDQLDLMEEASNHSFGWDTKDAADFNYVYDTGHVLVRTEDVGTLEGILDQLREVFEEGGGAVDEPIEGLTRYALPALRDGGGLLQALDILDEEFAKQFGDDPAPRAFGSWVTPDHIVHVTRTGGTCCPATEPTESALDAPWPPRSPAPAPGAEPVRVAVVDTGWHPPAAMHPASPWLAHRVDGEDENNTADLREYAGHGTFVAGVVRCLADAEITVLRLGFVGGGIPESEMVRELVRALEFDPQLINLSAGCTTRHNLPALAFEVFRRYLDNHSIDVVLVAAAGNDGSTESFWPASFDWAIGVGSLDRSGAVSSFSNHGDSADVYALGRNVVNAFPLGHYVCRETPDRGDQREFTTGLARWSGTSFAAPVVTGLIAARMAATGDPAPAAWAAVLATARHAASGHLVLPPPYA